MPTFMLLQVPDNVSNTFLGQGIIGAVALVAILAVFTLYKDQKVSHERERQRAERAEAKLDEVYKAIQDKYATTMTDTMRVVADALAQLRDQRP